MTPHAALSASGIEIAEPRAYVRLVNGEHAMPDPVPALVDTGSPLTLISASIAELVGIDVGRPSPDDLRVAVGGTETPVKPIAIDLILSEAAHSPADRQIVLTQVIAHVALGGL